MKGSDVEKETFCQVDVDEILIAMIISVIGFAAASWWTGDTGFWAMAAILAFGGWFAFMAGLYALRDFLKGLFRLY